MKRILALVLCAAILLSFPVVPLEAHAATYGYYSYNAYDGDYEGLFAIITDCDTSISGDIVIPSTLGGYAVTTIRSRAFEGCTSLKSVTIPDSVTTIGELAFEGCTSLTGIWADENNPYYASDIRGVLFNKDMTTLVLAPGALNGSYEIPDSVTSITWYAFEDCTSLQSVTIPDSVTYIGERAFYDCDSLTDVYYSGTWAQWYAINIAYGNDVLEHATIHCAAEPEAPDAADYACEVENGEVTITGYTGKGGNITIPATLRGLPVTSIGWGAFYGCDSLESVIIPDSVTSIGDCAFWICSSLQSVIIPDSVTSIGFQAFQECDSLTNITIPDSVTTIDDCAFWECHRLQIVTIPDSVTTIGESAFWICSSLQSVIIGNSVTTIGSNAFALCGSLESVTIGNSVTTIGEGAFYGCSLTDVYYAGSKAQWDAITIGEDNEDLINATIHYNHTHDYSLFDPVTVQYCDQTGYTEYTCIYGEKHRSPLPALGHLQETEGVVTPPTCTEDGYTAFVCARCSETVKTDMVSASGHNCTVFVETADPTCTEDGYTNMQCSNCEYVEKTNIVYALGHNMVALPAIAPTCTDSGLTAGSACSRCEMVGVAQKEVPSLGGHNFENGICTVCDTIALAITNLPSKLIYRAGEALDLSGLILLFNDKNGPTETVTEGFAVTGFDSETTGDKFVTVTYGEFSVEFVVTVVNADAQIIDENYNAYSSLSEAIAAVAPDDTLTLLEDIVENVTVNKDVILDLNSFDITGTITVAEGCTLYGMDAQTDDYTINDGYGYGKLAHVVGNVAGLPEDSDLAEDGYLMITEEDGISFHRVNLQLTHMTLRAESAGVYFKSAFGGDELVAENVAAFGVALSITDTPNQNNLGITSLFSRFDGANFTAGENRSDTTSTLLYDIMKTTNGRLTNTANARCPVHGRAYIQLQDGSYLFGGVATRSLQEQIEMIDTTWEDLRDAQKTPILQMYSQFKTVMRKWNIPSIIEAAK